MSNGMCGEFSAVDGPEAAAPGFKREKRYIVFKSSDLGGKMRETLVEHEDYVGRIRETHGKERRKFLVIESDWPEFEPAWDAIQRRMEGKPTREDKLVADVERLTRLNSNLMAGEMPVCGDCDGTGWLENRVEGRYACTCMTEAEPYQLLEQQLEGERESGAALVTLNDGLLSLNRQYTQRLGEMARLSDIVCSWVLEHGNLEEDSPEVKAAAEEIMEYVEAVRP